MKELSIEEKAKHYDEAIERAREYWETDNDNTLDIKAKGAMEYLFPELIGSKDERIRKALIHLISEEDGFLTEIDGINVKDILTWLEKQCEKIPVVEFNAKDWYVSKVDGKIYNAKFMEKTPINQTRKLEIEKAAMSATGIIEQEEWFIKGAEWSDKNPSYINSEK